MKAKRSGDFNVGACLSASLLDGEHSKAVLVSPSPTRVDRAADVARVASTLLFPLFCVFAGCIANTWVFEVLVRKDPGCGELLTMLQFAFTATMAAPGVLDFNLPCLSSTSSTKSIVSLKRRKYPLSYHILLVALYFTVSIINNMAVNYCISVPLHIIIRSGNILSNVVIGYLVFNSKYSPGQVGSVICLTVGIACCTLATASSRSRCCEADSTALRNNATINATVETEDASESHDLHRWLQGVGLLLFSLFINSFMGPVQDKMYSKYGRDNGGETLFFTHLLALPLFLISYPAMAASATRLLADPEVFTVPLLGMEIQASVVYLAVNLITQFVCIKGVYILVARTSSLATTVILSCRKFASIVFNVYIFKTVFTPWHYVGTLMVIAGSLLYATSKRPVSSTRSDDEEKKKLS